jgi:hypothetical protein
MISFPPPYISHQLLLTSLINSSEIILDPLRSESDPFHPLIPGHLGINSNETTTFNGGYAKTHRFIIDTTSFYPFHAREQKVFLAHNHR